MSNATQFVTMPMLQHRITLDEYYWKWEFDRIFEDNPRLQKVMDNQRSHLREVMQ